MNGFEKELREKVLGFTSHVTVYKNPTSENYDLSEFKNLKNKNKILGYSPYIERESLISSNISSTNAMVRAIEPELERNVGITHKNITSGSYAELEDSQDNIILGNGIALKLNVKLDDDVELFMQFPSRNGSKLVQFKNTYRVAGIFDVGIYEYNNAYAFINLNNLLYSLKKSNKSHINIDAIRIKLENPLDSYNFSSNFNQTSMDYYAQDWSFTHQSLFVAINNEKRVMFIILMLIVAVAAFNIVSSLLMLVTHKEKEIAILITLGAKKLDVLLIFLFQGLFLGLIGIVLGVFFGIILSVNIDAIITTIEQIFHINLMPAEIYHLTEIPSLIKYSDISYIVFFTFILTLFSAIYPALKASSIRPSEIFRGMN
tara:strand:- start:530 stop:1648 length:1119 start_codon:yes stop_codon:yes gene_type:complete